MSIPIEDSDLDAAALWAMIDSAAASYSSRAAKPRTKPLTPIPFPLTSPNHCRKFDNGEVYHPHKIPRTSYAMTPVNQKLTSPQLMMVKHVPRISVSTPDSPVTTTNSPITSYSSPNLSFETPEHRHSLTGPFPSVSLFKEYQNAAMAILEKGDYVLISGKPFIKKSGWRKISFYFNVSYEIRDKNIEFDGNRDVQRAEFVVRAHMQGGRFSDGWGSCEWREKKFLKPNHDIPSTAETRAKNKACQVCMQDLIGIGEYRPSESYA